MAATPPELTELRECACCPRQCRARRLDGKLGYCRGGVALGISSICIHHGEEPVISGAAGIANVFFTHCNMQCRYCQNWQISRNSGTVNEREMSLEEAAREIEILLDGGCRRVGFVSPSHYAPQVKALIAILRARGRNPRFVYNTNGYDRVETLRSLENMIDVCLPDLKYMDAELAARHSDAPDYPEVAAAALKEMYRQKGSYLRLDADGEIETGLIIRHLVLPGCVENSKRCLRFIAEELSPGVYLSLLSQYHPNPFVADDPLLGRRLRPEEYAEVVEEMRRLGFFRGWTQELANHESYRPDFTRDRPFAG